MTVSPVTTTAQPISIVTPIEGSFTPWAVDAKALTADHDLAWLASLYLVPVPGIDAFDRGAPVVAAMRGCGKSVLLRRRAARLILDKPAQNVLLRTVPPYVNEIEKDSIVVSEELGKALTSPLKWEALWLCAVLGHLAVRAMRDADAFSEYKTKSPKLKGSPGKGGSENVVTTDEDLVPSFMQHITDSAKRRKAITEGVNTGWKMADMLSYIWHSQGTPHTEFVGPLLQMLVNKGLHGDKPHIDACALIFANLLGQYAKNGHRYFAFVDAVDEALAVEDLNGQRVSLGSKPYVDATDVWVAAQKGLLYASSRVKSLAANATIFASVRGETIRQLALVDISRLGGSTAKITDVAFTELRFSDNELLNVFEVNVLRTADANLATPKATHAETRVFGFREVWHGSVPFHKETILNLIRRHTFGSPRDLVFLAKSAMDSVPANARSRHANKMLEALDRAAAKVCVDWINSAVPRLDHKFLHSMPSLDKNVYSHTEASAFEEQMDCPNFFMTLVQTGLAGTPMQNGHSHRVKFLSPRTGPIHLSGQDSAFYALHPALSALLANLRRLDCADELRQLLDLPEKPLPPFLYDWRFVVGDDLECPANVDEPIRLLCDLERWELRYGETSARKALVLDEICASSRGVSQNALTAVKRTLAAIILTAILEKKVECVVSFEEIKKNWAKLERVCVDIPSNWHEHLVDQTTGHSTLRSAADAILTECGLKLHFIPSRESVALSWFRDSANHANWKTLRLDEMTLRIPDQRSDFLGGPVIPEDPPLHLSRLGSRP